MIIFILILIAQASFTQAWNYRSHLIMARIAYDILKEEDPEALKKANELMLKFSDKNTIRREKLFPFVEGVTWADEIKYRGGAW